MPLRKALPAEILAIANLSPSNDDVIQRKSGAWLNRTTTQFMADLGALGQIPFPATQVPSAGANVLDDYEEGTWTPLLQFGGASVGMTYATQAAQYTKIGNLVRVGGAVVLSAKGSSTGLTQVGGLPFAHSAFLTSFNVFVTSMVSGVGDTMISALLGGGATAVKIYKAVSGTANQMTDADFGNSSEVYINGVYQV